MTASSYPGQHGAGFFCVIFQRSHKTLSLYRNHLLLFSVLVFCLAGAVNIRAAEPSIDSPVSYSQVIKPLLEQRCVVCHGCYDAPCQLKLSTPEGIQRGFTKSKVYHATRLMAAEPTRLFQDAKTLADWRAQGFSPVLPEGVDITSRLAADKQTVRTESTVSSLMSGVLALKRNTPLPVLADERLDPEAFDLSLNRKWSCPKPEQFASYARKNPAAGMPYALPALSTDEQQLLSRWLQQGAPFDTPVDFSGHRQTPDAYQSWIKRWEKLLNQPDLKSRLVARYLYEHLFLAHLYFPEVQAKQAAENQPARHFFQLVRSATPPGQPVQILATRRPFDAPPNPDFYYRLRLVAEPALAKTQMAYDLGTERLARIRELFYQENYQVTEWPGYRTEQAANPFITFRQLPAKARYQFMLDRAEFTIRSFMKGSVCRGQLALNVIDDRFWVFFVDPDGESLFGLNRVLQQHADYLDLPAKAQSNAEPLSNWLDLSSDQQRYLQVKSEVMNRSFAEYKDLGIELVWDGEGENPNAALTVFRHLDSASVHTGLLGGEPKTVWLIDYPILERIHYLLVAGFDVYGNAGHQLLTRLYMDFLRMESEFNFLTLLPAKARDSVIRHWYREASEDVRDYLQGEYAYMREETDIPYRSDNPKSELLAMLQRHLAPVLANKYALAAEHLSEPAYQALSRVDSMQGKSASLMPEISLVLVEADTPSEHTDGAQLFTILRNSAHSNISDPLNEESRRLPEEDTLTVLQGVTGAYPDAFWRMNSQGLSEFASRVGQLRSEEDYRQLMSGFGVRRSHPDFWSFSDRVHRLYRTQEPLHGGLLDYNRLENR